jgi:hypothetical protein
VFPPSYRQHSRELEAFNFYRFVEGRSWGT